MLENAIEYGNLGFIVFPVKGKKPVMQGWQELATNDPVKIPELFSRPYTGIGFLTGNKSGKTVIDVDVKDGKNGFKTLEALGIEFELTVCFETGTGGRQYIFEYCPEVLNSTDIFGEKSGIDIRNDGGLSVLPPSIHPDNGKTYKWIVEQSPTEVKVAPFPQDFLKAYKDWKKGGNGQETKFVLPQKIVNGQRNDQLFRFACSLRASGVGENEGLLKVKQTNVELCEEPVTDDEVGRLVKSAYKYDEPGLFLDEKGRVKKNILNVIAVFELDTNLIGLFYYNLLAGTIHYSRTPSWDKEIKPEKRLTDEDSVQIKHHLSKYHQLEVSVRLIEEALVIISRKKTIHPVRDYLNSLKWDGVNRLDNWLSVSTGAPQDLYSSWIGRKILIGAVARVFNPGVKFDYMLILEGAQGIGKSQVVKVLGGEWYVSVNITDNDKETIDCMLGSWIIEIEEMVCFKKQEVEHLKAFISRSSDRVRLSYGRRSQDFPRQSIFIGTINPSGDSDYLQDATGNRRFWPVLCTKDIDLNWVRENRDQLFAEALMCFKGGEKVFIDNPKVEKLITEQQEARQSKDPWTLAVFKYIKGKTEVTTLEMLDYFGVYMEKMTKSHQTRIGVIMKDLGWVRKYDRKIKCSVYHAPTVAPTAKVEISQVDDSEQQEKENLS